MKKLVDQSIAQHRKSEEDADAKSNFFFASTTVRGTKNSRVQNRFFFFFLSFQIATKEE